jgi:uncharacterized protein YjbJ (UPF0337 family)
MQEKHARRKVMINQQILQGRWSEIKGKIRSHWGQLTDDDLPQFHGEVEKLVGTIQRKTGEGREVIENYLSELSGAASSAMGQTAETVRQFSRQAADFSRQAADTVQATAKQAADQLQAGYIQAERFVRERPRESLVVCFGIGLLAGVLVSMMMSSKS